MSFIYTLFLLINFSFFIDAQQAGTQQTEAHPKLSWKKCSGRRCVSQPGELVADADSRWLHNINGSIDCQPQGKWNTTLCPDGLACAKSCALDGIDSYEKHGVVTKGNSLTMKLGTTNEYGPPRLYLMANESQYAMFHLLNKEFTFDVDMSKLPCGTNGALYFAEMDADGGMSKYPSNKAGAKYGTGYCDAQCPSHPRFIQGEASVSSANGTQYGACCNEMDIWEANKIATAYTPHTCTQPGNYRCLGKECDGVCDKGGCDFNSYRMGDRNFYGPGKNSTVNTERKMTVVTQFVTEGNKTSAPLIEIRRLYIQNKKIIHLSFTSVPGMKKHNSISDTYCAARSAAFNESDASAARGGLKTMGESLARGVVLIFSLWTDSSDTAMMWLDGEKYPANATAGAQGSARGTCSAKESGPKFITENFADAAVVFADVKVGDIGSTFAEV
jgi:cellulose 1,4-beta-cellobiosidase